MSDLSRITVLIVEDNPDDQWYTRRCFKKHSPETSLLLAEDGVAALDVIRDTPPHLVLLDMNLPRMGGREVLRLLRGDAATQKLPVVAFTTDDDDPDEFAGDDYTVCLRKPLDFERMRVAFASLSAVAGR